MMKINNQRITNVLLVLFVLFWKCSVTAGKTFKIAFLAPGRTSNYPINSDNSVDGINLALRSISKNPNILNGHKIAVKFFDTKCNAQSAVTAAMMAKRSFDPDVIVGPPCHQGLKMVAQLGTYWNLPILSWHHTGNDFNSAKTYPTLVRMTPPLHLLSKSMVHVLTKNSWNHVSVLYIDQEPWSLLEDPVREDAALGGVEIHGVYKVASSMPLTALKQMYTHIQRVANAVVMICPFDRVRHFMLAAATVGLTNGSYAFIHLDPKIYTDTELATKVLSNGGWKRGDPQDEQARKAYESVIHLVIDPTTERAGQRVLKPSSKYTEYSRMAVYESKFTEPGWNLPSGKMPDVYSAYLCDAVVVWSVLVDMLDKLGKDYRDGNLMATYMRRMTAEGATGYIELNNNLDRLGEVYILDMQPDGNFEPIEFLKFNKTDGYTSTNIDRLIPPPVTEALMSRPVVGHFSSIHHVKSVNHVNKKPIVIAKTSSRPQTTTKATSTSLSTPTTQATKTTTKATTTTTKATTTTTKATTTAALTSKVITTQTTANVITTIPPTTATQPTSTNATSTLPPTTTVSPTADTITTQQTTAVPVKASTTPANIEQSILARLQAIEAAMKLSQQQAIKETYLPKTTTPPPIVGIVNRPRKVTLDPHLNNFDVRLKKKRRIYAKAQTILDTIRETGDPNVAEFLRLALDRLNAEEELLTLKQQRNLAKKREMNKLKTNNSPIIEAPTYPMSSYKQSTAPGTTQLVPSTTPRVEETTIAKETSTPPATQSTTKLTEPTTVVTTSTPKPIKSPTTIPTTLLYYDEITTQDIIPKRKKNGKKPKRRLRQKWLSEVTPPSTTPAVTTPYPPGAEVDIIMADNKMISSIVDQVASKLMGKVTGEIQTLKQSIKTMQSTIAKNASKNGSGHNVVSAPQGQLHDPLLDIKKDINRSLIREISANVLTKLSGVSWLEQKPSEPKTNQVFQKPQLAAAISQPTNRIRHAYQAPLIQSTLPPPRPVPQTTIKPTTRKPAPPRVLGSWMSGLPSAVSMQLFALEPGSQRNGQQPNAQLNSVSISSPNRHNSNDKPPRMSTRNNPMNIRHTSPQYKAVQVNQGVTKSYELPVTHAELFKNNFQHVKLPGANNAIPIQKETNHNNIQPGPVIQRAPDRPVQQSTAHQNNQPVPVNHNPIQNPIQSTQTGVVPQIQNQSFQSPAAYQTQDIPTQNAVQTRNQPVQLATTHQARNHEIQQAPIYQTNNQLIQQASPQQARNKPIQQATMHQAQSQPIQQAPVYQTQSQPVHQASVSQTQNLPLQQSPPYQTQSQPIHSAPALQIPNQPIQQAPAYQTQGQPMRQVPVSQTQSQPIHSAPALQIPNQPIQQAPAYQTQGQPTQQAISYQAQHQPIQPAAVHQPPSQHVQPPSLNMDSIIANITNSVLAGVNKQIDSLKNTMTSQGNAAQQPKPQPPALPTTPEPVFSLRHMFHKTAAPNPNERSGKTRLTAQTPDDIVNQISDAVIKQLSSGHVNAHVEQRTDPPPPPRRRRPPTTTTTDKPQEHEPEPQKSNGKENKNNGGGNLADSIASKVFGKMNAKLDALSNTVNNLQRNIGQQELEEMPPEMFGRRGYQMGGHEQMMQMPNMPPMGMMPMPYPQQSLRQAFVQGTQKSPPSDTVTQPAPPTPPSKDLSQIKFNLPTEVTAPAWAPPTINPWMNGGMPNQGNMWGSPRSSWWA